MITQQAAALAAKPSPRDLLRERVALAALPAVISRTGVLDATISFDRGTTVAQFVVRQTFAYADAFLAERDKVGAK